MNIEVRSENLGNLDTLPVTVRYGAPTSSELQGEISLRGGAQALQTLATLLRSSLTTMLVSLEVPPSQAPDPYDEFLESLVIHQTTGAVIILKDQNNLLISGSIDKLAVLADNFAALAESSSSGGYRHIHIEYFPGDRFLDIHSIPLVAILLDEK